MRLSFVQCAVFTFFIFVSFVSSSILISSSNDIESVALAPLSNDTFVSVWCDETEDDITFSVYYTNGTVLLSDVDADDSAGTCYYPREVAVSSFNSTAFVVAWTDNIEQDTTFRVYDVYGNSLSSEVDVDSASGYPGSAVSVSALNSSAFVVSWIDDIDFDSSFAIYDISGTELVSEVDIDTDVGTNSYSTSVSAFNESVFVIGWFDDTDDDATFAVYDVSGTELVSPIDVDTSVGHSRSVAVSAFNESAFAIAWFDSLDRDASFAVYTWDGVELVGEVDADDDILTTSYSVSVAAINQTHFAVGWFDVTDVDYTYSIYDYSGNLFFGPFDVVTDVDVSGGYPFAMTGYIQATGIGLCNDNFLFSYGDTNTHSAITSYKSNGVEWNGICAQQTHPNLYQPQIDSNVESVIGSTIRINTTITAGSASLDSVILEINPPISDSYNVTPSQDGNEFYLDSLLLNESGDWSFSFFVNDTDGFSAPFLTARSSDGYSYVSVIDGYFLTSDDVESLSSTILDEDTVVISWCDETSDSNKFKIFDSDGEAVTGIITVDSSSSSCVWMNEMSVVALNESVFVVGWADNLDDDVTFKVYNSNGVALIDEVDVDTDAGAAGISVSIAALNSTAFVVSWIDDIDGDASFAVYDVSGSQLLGETDADADVGANSYSISASAFNDTTFVIGWFDDTDDDATFAIYDVSGTELVSPIDADTAVGTSRSVSVSVLNETAFVIGWFDSVDRDASFAIYDVSGTELVSEVDADENVNSNSYMVTTTAINSTAFGISWYDILDLNYAFAVYSSDGTVITSPVNITTVVSASSLYPITMSSSSYATGNSLCDNNLLLSWGNTDSTSYFSFYQSNGSVWSGTCSDSTAPGVTIVTPSSTTYTSSDFPLSFNVSLSENGSVRFTLDNGTTNYTMDSEDNLYFNYTFSSLDDGTYFFTVYANDTSGNSNHTEYVIFLADTSPPVITLSSPASSLETVTDNLLFNFTATDALSSVLNCSIYVDSVLIQSNSSTLNNTLSTFNLTDISEGAHNWSISCSDSSSNSNISVVRNFSIDLSGPLVFDFLYSPNSTSTLDPGILLTFNTSVNDSLGSVSSVYLQYFNDSSWANLTLDNLSSSSYGGFLNLSSSEQNYTVYVWTNDSLGNVNVSSNLTIVSAWDCSWSLTSDLGVGTGFDSTEELANLTISNTGDVEYPTSNCTLNFRIVDNLASGRVGFDNDFSSSHSVLGVAANTTEIISVSALFIDEIIEESVTINVTETTDISDDYSQTSSLTLISNQAGPYLYQGLRSYPTSVSLTSGNTFSLSGYVQNLMGELTPNASNTAYNVTINWTLSDGLTNSSGNLSRDYENITDSDLHYHNTTISFDDVSSFEQGIHTLYLFVYGYNLSGNLVSDANNVTYLSSAFNITFLCDSESDGVIVEDCGSLDGDYVAPESSSSSSSGGGGSGGGGGGNSILTLNKFSSSNFELLTGDTQEFTLLLTNNLSGPQQDVTVSVDGIDSDYITLYPVYIPSIPVGGTREVYVTIRSPSYSVQGTYTLDFHINGDFDINGSIQPFKEYREVTLQLLEVSREDATLMLDESYSMYQRMSDANMRLHEAEEYLSLIEAYYEDISFLELSQTYSSLKSLYDAAFGSLQSLEELREGIDLAEYNGLTVSETKRLFFVGQAAYDRGDYFVSQEKLTSAQLTYALETKGKFNLYYLVKNNPKESGLSLLAFFVFSLSSSVLFRVYYYRRKLYLLGKEEVLLLELMKVVQSETFERNKMSMEEYNEAMHQYETKLSTVVEDRVKYQSKLSTVLRVKSKHRGLLDEKRRMLELVKVIQDKYLNKGSLETRIYDNMMKNYTERLSDIEEELAVLDSQYAMRKRNRLFGFLGSGRGNLQSTNSRKRSSRSRRNT